MKNQTVKIATTLLVLSTFLLGANVPNIGDIEKQVQPPKDLPKKTTPLVEVGESRKYASPMLDDKSGRTIFVKSFTFNGNAHVNTEELQTIAKEYENKELTFREISELTTKTTKLYREKGYFVARAYLPEQNVLVNDNVLEIAIIEGNYGEFKLTTNRSLVNNASVQAMLDAIKGDNIVSTHTLERAMLIINDTPGAKVTAADVMPGANVGTSDFAITTEATNATSAYIIGDNYGSQYTGRYRANVGLSANSPLGFGDKLGINGVISTQTDLKNGRIYYSFPLMANGLRGELSTSKTNYTLGDTYASLDALGTSTTFDATLSYPLIRTRLESLHLSFGLAQKKMKDEVRSTLDVTKKEAMVGTLGLNYAKELLLFGFNGKTTASVSFSHGRLDFKDAASLALDKAGADTNGVYSKISGSLEHYMQFTQNYALATSLRFQKALGGKNLDGSEDFSLGGAYGVRAFPDGEHSAENGYVIGAEFFYTLPEYQGILHKLSFFADTGYATMENPLLETESRHLSAAGIGYRAFYKEFFVKAQAARVIGGEKVESEDKRSTRFLLQGGWVY